MAADGTITFSTALDNSDLEKNIKAAEKRIDELKDKIERGENEKNAIAEQIAEAEKAAKRAEASLDRLKERRDELMSEDTPRFGAVQAVDAEIAAQQKALAAATDKRIGLYDKWLEADAAVEKYAGELSTARAKQAELGAEAQRRAKESSSAWSRASSALRGGVARAAAFARAALSGAASQAAGPWETLSKKIVGSLRKVFVFSMIVKGVRAIKDEIASMISENQAVNASVENLKAVLRGFVVSFAGAILPALKAVVDTIAGVFERIAGLVDSVFGTNIMGAIQGARSQASAQIQQGNAEKRAKYESDVAKAQQKQAAAAKKLAKEQKEANSQLMSFDELNVLSAESSEDAADAMEDYMDGIEEPSYDADWTSSLAPDAGILGGVLDWFDEIKNRILNDVAGPFARIREGLELIKQGWDELVQGVMTGDWKLAWQGVRDIVIGALYVVEGAFGALMDWLDEVTGGRFHGIFDGMKEIVGGFVDVVEGLLRGDLQMAFDGLVRMVEGAAELLHGVVDGVFDLLRAGIDLWFAYLVEKHPELANILEAVKGTLIGLLDSAEALLHGALEFARLQIEGVLDIIVGIFTLDGDLIMKGFGKMSDGAVALFKGVLDAVWKYWGPIADLLDRNVVKPVRSAFSNAWSAIKSGAGGASKGVKDAFSGIAGFFKQIFGDAWKGVKEAFESGGQVFAGVVDAIVSAFKTLANNAISGLNWAIAQPFAGMNDIISALNGWMILDFYPFNFSTIPVPTIPYLAGGAVIPPNREFLAVLGDQPSGRNLEAPESLIRQIVREEAGGFDSRALTLLSQILQAVQSGHTLECDGYTLAKVVNDRNKVNRRMIGA